jgi:hypothetical protein
LLKSDSNGKCYYETLKKDGRIWEK